MVKEGTDDSPVELDGLGGNAGISTPYLPFGGNPPQQYPEYQQLDDESVTRINGQDVRATLDGVGIPFGFALHLLQNGAALPAALDRYQRWEGFRFESAGSGIFRTTIPDVFTNREGSQVWTEPHGSLSEGTRYLTAVILLFRLVNHTHRLSLICMNLKEIDSYLKKTH